MWPPAKAFPPGEGATAYAVADEGYPHAKRGTPLCTALPNCVILSEAKDPRRNEAYAVRSVRRFFASLRMTIWGKCHGEGKPPPYKAPGTPAHPPNHKRSLSHVF